MGLIPFLWLLNLKKCINCVDERCNYTFDVRKIIDILCTFIAGVAFRGLPDVNLYPAVSAVYGNTEVSMVYLGQPLDG